MKEITCAWGNDIGVTLVSDEDYPELREHKWHITTANASGKPYVRSSILGKTVYMHRAVVKLAGPLKVDHRNGDGLHNYRSNLRVATQDENNLNRRGFGAVEYKGVSRDGRRYRARIMHGGVAKSLGYFESAMLAAFAYDSAAHELFGEFAWLNFPEEFPRTVELSAVEIPF